MEPLDPTLVREPLLAALHVRVRRFLRVRDRGEFTELCDTCEPNDSFRESLRRARKAGEARRFYRVRVNEYRQSLTLVWTSRVDTVVRCEVDTENFVEETGHEVSQLQGAQRYTERHSELQPRARFNALWGRCYLEHLVEANSK